MAITNNRVIMSDATSGAKTSTPTLSASQFLHPAIAQATTPNLPDFQAYRAEQSVNNSNNAAQQTTNTSNNQASSASSAPAASSAPDYMSYYNSILDAINQQRAAQEAAARQNYENAIARMRDAYNTSVGNLNNQSDDALRQAYINNMMGKRNMNQALANMGVNGGATESILANLQNNYMNDRNSINKTLLSSLQNLESDYNNNLANLSADINNTNASILDNYYDKLVNYQSNYANTLADLAKASASRANSSSSSSSSSTSEAESNGVWGNYKESDIVKTVQALKASPSAVLSFLNKFRGASNAEKEMILFQAGIDPASLVAGTTNNNSVTNLIQAIEDEEKASGKTTVSGGGKSR